MNGLTRLVTRNYRSLAKLDLKLEPINVIFGPNGAGKSTLLDVIYFVRACAIQGIPTAAEYRSHGIGMLWDGAANGDVIEVGLGTDGVNYSLAFGMAGGRIEPFVGERLNRVIDGVNVIERPTGAIEATFFDSSCGEYRSFVLREPDRLSLSRYLDFNPADIASLGLDKLLRMVRWYHSRSFYLNRLKKDGSSTGPGARLLDSAQNAWAVLRGLNDRRDIDPRYSTVMGYMREAFPKFRGLLVEQTGADSVYASFLERGRTAPILASGMSDGVLQLLLLLTALFGEASDEPAILLFDEPELSLHPWAIAVFAKAVEEAVASWNRQVLIATHSPVLVSQFEPHQILAAEIEADGSSTFQRLSERDDLRELLADYAVGALYMSEAVAAQSASAGD